MPRPRALVLLATLLTLPALAGCAETLAGADADPALDGALAEAQGSWVHGLDGRAAPAGALLAAGLPAARGLQLSIGVDAYEPTLGVDAAGALFMTGFRDGNAPTTMRSLDGGLSWEDVGPRLPTGRSAHPFTFDPYLYLDPATGRVFQNDNTLGCAMVSFSDDQGASWTTTPVGCALGGGLKDHQSMVAARPRLLQTVGYPHVVYTCTNTGASTECATSLNGGISFGPAVTVFPAPGPGAAGYVAGDCEGILSHPAADSGGRVFVAHHNCGVPEIAATQDDGLTWTASTISADVKRYPHILMHDVSLAVDEADNVYAAWMAEDGLPYYASSVDHGRTWSPARRLSPPGVTAAMLVDVEAGAPGRLVAAYVATDVEGGYGDKPTGGSGTVTDLEPYTEPDAWKDATWHAYLTVIPDALAEDPVALTVTANDPADPVARGVCGKTRCGGMGDFIDVRIAPDGRPYAAFVDACTAACVTDPTVLKDAPLGFVGTLAEGPALRGDLRALAPLATLTETG